MIILRNKIFSKRMGSSLKTDYSILHPGAANYAKWRRRTDSGLKTEIKQIDRRAKGVAAAFGNTLGAIKKGDIRSRQRATRQAANFEKINKLLG